MRVLRGGYSEEGTQKRVLRGGYSKEGKKKEKARKKLEH